MLLKILFGLQMLAAGDANLTNVLIPGQNIQVSSNINDEYSNIYSGRPIHGTVMVTHGSGEKVDENSFRFGNQPLKVQFVQTTAMSSFNNLVVSIYKFELEGYKAGAYTLPPISVNVAGKNYQAPPLNIQVN